MRVDAGKEQFRLKLLKIKTKSEKQEAHDMNIFTGCGCFSANNCGFVWMGNSSIYTQDLCLSLVSF